MLLLVWEVLLLDFVAEMGSVVVGLGSVVVGLGSVVVGICC